MKRRELLIGGVAGGTLLFNGCVNGSNASNSEYNNSDTNNESVNEDHQEVADENESPNCEGRTDWGEADIISLELTSRNENELKEQCATEAAKEAFSEVASRLGTSFEEEWTYNTTTRQSETIPRLDYIGFDCPETAFDDVVTATPTEVLVDVNGNSGEEADCRLRVLVRQVIETND